MIEALRSVGVVVDVSDRGRTLTVDGAAQWEPADPTEELELFIANSGTSVRGEGGSS